jgi:ferredoxin--NADP+ reductase
MNITIPLNLFTIKNPLLGEVVENVRLTPATHGVQNNVHHITVRYQKEFSYAAGQSVGVIVPGVDSVTNKPHKLRLYSIASAREGDALDSQTVSLCVARHHWNNKETGEESIRGVASNYLCDLKPGESVSLTGPVGRHFLLPDDYLNKDFIFVATGTGIAPYRGMLKEMFANGFGGQAALYFGVQYEDVALYDEEFKTYLENDNFAYVKALSREEKNPIPKEIPTRADRMYVQVKMFLDREWLESILGNPDSMIYLCGLKGMEQGIFPVLEKIGQDLGVKDSFISELKAAGRLKVEVY